MIATITSTGTIVFDLDIQSPWDWIDCLWDAFPNDKFYIGCFNGYENCLWQHKIY